MVRTTVRSVGSEQGESLPKNCGNGGKPLTVLYKTYFRI